MRVHLCMNVSLRMLDERHITDFTTDFNTDYVYARTLVHDFLVENAGSK